VELTSSSLVTDPSAAGSRAYSTPPNAALFIYAQTEHLHQPIMQHHHTCHSKPSKLGKKAYQNVYPPKTGLQEIG